ncbi:MAG: Carboxyl-terminal protease [uncultured bacterium]|nr:MAG: Carboxyl-terminal protease [uncultured bacterium]HBD05029.1 S41 family peptidase [Candidatus Uhrbacteria bacterium]
MANKKVSAWIKAISLFLAGFLASFLLGFNQTENTDLQESNGVLNILELPKKDIQDVDFRMYWDVWNLIRENYIDQPVSEKELFYGSLRGMVSALDDQHSYFFDPEEASAFNSELDGSFGGIGAQVGIKDEQLQVIAPLPDSPAERAGLRAGDKIFFINSEDAALMTVEEAVMKIRGNEGTTVTLSIGRDGEAEEKEIIITREIIEIDSVEMKLEGDTAVISIYFFNEDTSRLFNESVNEILKANVKKIVLDLRSNPGGLLDQAIEVASEWVDGNLVSIQETRNEQIPLSATGVARLRDFPTVVLVDGGTASGSEIVAGALQDYGLATIVGTQTFGKGSVQDYEMLPDGSAVKITVAKWLTPNGRAIDKVGITPDVVVEYTEQDALDQKDPQKDRAFEILNNGD